MKNPTHRGARFGAPRVVTLAIAMASFATSIAFAADARSAPTPRTHVASTKDSPGYVPLVDPESTSVVVGRRLNAPLVSHRFTGGARSLDDLGRAVCRALHRGDRDSLTALCVRAEEFRDILWREFPQSRPVTGLQWEDGWRVLGNRLAAGTSQAILDHGGRFWEFVAIEVDSVARYRNFRIHAGLTLVVRDDLGRVQRMSWLRAVVERKGTFKISSTAD